MGHRQKKKLPSSVLLLLWPGEVRRKREGDSGQTGPALFAGSNKTELGKFFFCRCLWCEDALTKKSIFKFKCPSKNMQNRLFAFQVVAFCFQILANSSGFVVSSCPSHHGPLRQRECGSHPEVDSTTFRHIFKAMLFGTSLRHSGQLKLPTIFEV